VASPSRADISSSKKLKRKRSNSQMHDDPLVAPAVRRFIEPAKAAESLLKPSSARARGGQRRAFIERVDLLMKLISQQLGEPNAGIDRTVQIVDQKLNEKIVVGGSGSALGGTSG